MATEIYIHNSAVCRPVMSIVGMLVQRDNIIFGYNLQSNKIIHNLVLAQGTFIPNTNFIGPQIAEL